MVWILSGQFNSQQNEEEGSQPSETRHQIRPSRNYLFGRGPVKAGTKMTNPGILDFWTKSCTVPKTPWGMLISAPLEKEKDAKEGHVLKMKILNEKKDFCTLERAGESISCLEGESYLIQSGDVFKFPKNNKYYFKFEWVDVFVGIMEETKQIKELREWTGIKFIQGNQEITQDTLNQLHKLSALPTRPTNTPPYQDLFNADASAPENKSQITKFRTSLRELEVVSLGNDRCGADWGRIWGHSALELNWDSLPQLPSFIPLVSTEDQVVKNDDQIEDGEREKIPEEDSNMDISETPATVPKKLTRRSNKPVEPLPSSDDEPAPPVRKLTRRTANLSTQTQKTQLPEEPKRKLVPRSRRGTTPTPTQGIIHFPSSDSEEESQSQSQSKQSIARVASQKQSMRKRGLDSDSEDERTQSKRSKTLSRLDEAEEEDEGVSVTIRRATSAALSIISSDGEAPKDTKRALEKVEQSGRRKRDASVLDSGDEQPQKKKNESTGGMREASVFASGDEQPQKKKKHDPTPTPVDPSNLLQIPTRTSRTAKTTESRKLDAQLNAEFNALKIVKPTMLKMRVGSGYRASWEREDEQDEMERMINEDQKLLEEGEEGDWMMRDRGMFEVLPLIIEEKPMKRTGRGADEGVPNFKRFRPKGTKNKVLTEKPKIEFVIDSIEDFGLGAAYNQDLPLKDSKKEKSIFERERARSGFNGTQQTTLDQAFGLSRQSPATAPVPTKGRKPLRLSPSFESDSEEGVVIQKSKPKATAKAAPTRRTKPSQKYVEPSDDDDLMAVDSDPGGKEERSITPTLRVTSQRRKPPPSRVVEESDSDDGMTFKGFKGSLRSRLR